MTGHLETIQFNIDTNGTSMQVRSEVVKPPNGQTKYGIHGLAASRNAAFLLIAYYARRVRLLLLSAILWSQAIKLRRDTYGNVLTYSFLLTYLTFLYHSHSTI